MTVTKCGIRLQKEVWSWYLEASNAMVDWTSNSEDRNLVRAHNARQELLKAISSGWKLLMSDEGSPADKAGIDFIWFLPARGWYPIDTTAMNKVGVPELINIATVRNSEAKSEFGKLRFEDKVAFIELLVRLAESEPTLKVDLQPPTLRSCGQGSMKTLIEFQKRLTLRSSDIDGEPFKEWANYLGRAINYESRMKQRAASTGSADIRQVLACIVRTEVEAFLAKASSGFNCGKYVQQPYARQFGICYYPHQDTLTLPEPQSPQVHGLAQAARKLFAELYGKLVSECGASEELIACKRFFEGRGFEEITHRVLDALEKRYSADTGRGSRKRSRRRSRSRSKNERVAA